MTAASNPCHRMARVMMELLIELAPDVKVDLK